MSPRYRVTLSKEERKKLETITLREKTHARKVSGVEKVHAIMGGFHLGGPLFESIVEPTTEGLKAFSPDYVIPCHCTGRKAIMHIEREMPDQFILNMSGTKLTFST